MDKFLKLTFVFSLAGFLFSGWLTLSKIVFGYCPILEGCPLFLGEPACYYGFFMFSILLAASALMILGKFDKNKLKQYLIYTSAAGIVFSGYFVFQEIFYPTCVAPCTYTLLLPTCVYGLFMYIGIFLAARKL